MDRRIVVTDCLLALLSITFVNSCSMEGEKTIPGSHTVEISGMQFHPGEIKVKKGDTVTFVNKDIVVHDVAEEKSKKWASPPLSTGQFYKIIASESSDYYCTIHLVMKGKLLVE